MSPRRIIFIAVALLVSGLTMWMGRSYLEAQRRAALEAQRQQPTPQQPATMVLVAKGNLSAGQFVRAENLRWQPWPADGIAPSYIVQGQRQLEDFIGAVVRSGVGDGEPVTETRLVRPRDRGFLAAVLDPGYRAVTVNVTPSSGVAGFIYPGDHVDMIVTLQVTSEGKDPINPTKTVQHQNRVSETVLHDVRVLAIDQRADDQTKDAAPKAAALATLQVTPKQAEVVAVVGSVGQISLSLRSLARDEAEAAADSGRQQISYTFDSDATKLLQPPGGGGHGGAIEVVRGTKLNKGIR
ncbi:MAG TPA: Flp pilus assembly protein CpaB [Stellaceae bacterium]|nr:Flp pilus assembly protein CpaB [Stellaceae bacterium]